MQRFLREFKNSRQGSALVFTLLVFAVLMILASAAIAVTGTDSQVASAQEGSKAALYVAESGIDIVKQQIIQAIDAGTTVTDISEYQKVVPGGKYDYSISCLAGNQYQIDVKAMAIMPNGESATKNVRVIFKYGSNSGGNNSGGNDDSGNGNDDSGNGNDDPGDGNDDSGGDNDNPDGDNNSPNDDPPGDDPPVEEEPPADEPPVQSSTTAFEYAVLGQGKGTGMFQLTGDIKIQGPMHSNSSIHFNNNGNNAGLTVSGPVSTTDEIKIIGKSGDFSGVEMIVGAPPVIMPEINWDYIKANATKIYYGNTSLNGASDIHNNSVIFVEGDLTLIGEVSGNALIVATGDITISGDYDYPSSDYAAVGFIAGKNLKLFGDHGGFDLPGVDGPEIQGFVIALNNVIVQGEARITGSLISGNNVECGSGELQVEFVDGDDNPVDKVFEIKGTDIIANYDEL